MLSWSHELYRSSKYALRVGFRAPIGCKTHKSIRIFGCRSLRSRRPINVPSTNHDNSTATLNRVLWFRNWSISTEKPDTDSSRCNFVPRSCSKTSGIRNWKSRVAAISASCSNSASAGAATSSTLVCTNAYTLDRRLQNDKTRLHEQLT